MHPIRKLCRLACLAGLLLGLTLCLSGPTFAQKGEGKGKGKGQPEIVEVDLSKLPPGLAMLIRDALKAPEPKAKEKGKKKDDGKKDKDGKKKAKDISLTDAIRIAETVSKGECVKAERKSKDGQTQFKLEVLARDGSKERLTLDARGNVLQQEQKGGKKKDDGKKGKR